jgi:sulfate transport system permease protein
MRARRHLLPGFGLSLGVTMTFLSLFVLIPIALLAVRASQIPLHDLVTAAMQPRVMRAYVLSLSTAAVAAVINTVFGTVTAWALVRYEFPGRRFIDGAIDLPFALPTSVAGITLTAIYGPTGFFGKPLALLGIKAAYSPIGIIIALVFVGLPFVVRTVQPAVESLDAEPEEAARSLGASKFQTFLRVTAPELWPAVVTGFGLAFARALGEYGSVIFISGNLPGYTETIPLLVMIRLEEFDYNSAIAIAVMYLGIALTLLLAVKSLQRGRWKAVAA